MSSARVLDSSRRQIVNRVIDRGGAEDRSHEYPGRAAALLFFRPSCFVILHCQIRLDVFLPQVGLCDRVSPGWRRSYSLRRWVRPTPFARRAETSPRLSSTRDLRFLSDFPFEICIMYITARPFRKWETYLAALAGLTFLSRCFFPFWLLPRLRDFI